MRLDPYFQPIMTTATSHVFGTEALFRLHGSTTFPAQQFRSWERSGQIALVDTLFVRCLARLGRAGLLPIRRVWVNAAPRTLEDHGKGYLRAVSDLRRVADAVVVELVESYPIRDVNAVVEFSQACATADIQFGLDDCAPGHPFCDPGFVRAIRPDYMKLDAALVTRAAEGDHGGLCQVMDLAARYGARTVIEGIDQQCKLDVVHEVGGTYWQGYLGGHPAPVRQAATNAVRGIAPRDSQGLIAAC